MRRPTVEKTYGGNTGSQLAFTATMVAPAAAGPTLKATVTGSGAAGTVEFFNGTTSLGAPSAISAGVASKTLTGVVAGSYSYKAVFTPTDAAAFTSSTSSTSTVSAYVVTAAPVPVVIAPVISALSPANGAIGDTVTIAGTGFGTGGTLMFGTTPLDYTSADGLLIDVVAPTGVRRAKVTVTPTDGVSADTASNSVIFKYNRIPRVK